MTNQKVKEVHVRLSEKDFILLEDFCRQWHCSKSWLCRHALVIYLQKKGSYNK